MSTAGIPINKYARKGQAYERPVPVPASEWCVYLAWVYELSSVAGVDFFRAISIFVLSVA
jgi:hypothetical protein